MVKRIILAALVGLLVSWPVLAADDGVGVLLHCAGWIQNVSGERHGIATNVQIAREGSWIMWAGEKRAGQQGNNQAGYNTGLMNLGSSKRMSASFLIREIWT